MTSAEAERVRVSVVIPCYYSTATLRGCLDALRAQTCRGFEVLVVNSSPDAGALAPLRVAYPEVRWFQAPGRLLPHAARNLGAGHARGEVLVFTDPDIDASPRWLERLLETHRAHGGVVVGALLSAASGWVSQGTHLVKFDQWLPGARFRANTVALTGNCLFPRSLFERHRGFDGGLMLGDAELSWRLRRAGTRFTFAPEAVVRHRHRESVSAMLRERSARGCLYGALRRSTDFAGRGRWHAALQVVLLPLRWFKITARVGANARRSGLLGVFLWTLPLVLAGEAAWLLGELRTYLGWLRSAGPKESPCAS